MPVQLVDLMAEARILTNLNGIQALRLSGKKFQCLEIDLVIKDEDEFEEVEEFLLRNSFPCLLYLRIRYSGEEITPHLRLQPLPRLLELHLTHIVLQDSVELPSLIKFSCNAGLVGREQYEPSPYSLCSMLQSSSNASDVRFVNSFFPMDRNHFHAEEPILVQKTLLLRVEDDWKYIRPAMEHIALPLIKRLDIVAYADPKHLTHLSNLEFGFWGDIMPRNKAITMPIFENTRALRYMTNLHVPYAPVTETVPLRNGVVLAGGLHESAFEDTYATGAWSITATDCGEFVEEFTPRTLIEIRQHFHVAMLISLEMHTIPYISPNEFVNEWAVFFEGMVSLRRLEVGGEHALALIFQAFTEISNRPPLLPSLTELSLCIAALPGESRNNDYIHSFPTFMYHIMHRPNSCLRTLLLRVPPKVPQGRLHACPVLKPQSDHIATTMRQMAIAYLGDKNVRCEARFCGTCHDGDPELCREHVH